MAMPAQQMVESQLAANATLPAPSLSQPGAQSGTECLNQQSPYDGNDHGTKRKLTLEVWNHFKRQKINNKWKAICNYCKAKLLGDPKLGTPHLRDHRKSCKLRTTRDIRQSFLKTNTSPSGETVLNSGLPLGSALDRISSHLSHVEYVTQMWPWCLILGLGELGLGMGELRFVQVCGETKRDMMMILGSLSEPW
ncbi:hypothetical protein PIB30_092803 [Stylosanthes scabra]|uniref:BED-type domain-containing protein n=1 Tax=Stylosanthes scabra TaxID=79078 RepID=A0ABU6RVY5_9FABA|nr:hypothetical protein [Stylosanthes scabra]